MSGSLCELGGKKYEKKYSPSLFQSLQEPRDEGNLGGQQPLSALPRRSSAAKWKGVVVMTERAREGEEEDGGSRESPLFRFSLPQACGQIHRGPARWRPES